MPAAKAAAPDWTPVGDFITDGARCRPVGAVCGPLRPGPRRVLSLPHKQRALVVLYYYEDRPLTEAGELLGLHRGAAKVALHRARRRLALGLTGTSPLFDAPDARGALTTAESRPWDAELREDLHARGDRLAVDVEAALRSVNARSDRARHRRTWARSAGVAFAAAASVTAVVVAGPVLRDRDQPPPATRTTVSPTLTKGSPSALLRAWHRTVAFGNLPATPGVSGGWSMRLARTDNGVLALTGPAGGPATDGVAYAVDADRLRVDAFGNDLCATLDAGVYRWSRGRRDADSFRDI